MIPADVRRELDEIKQGATYTGGTVTLNVSSTSTVVSRRGVSSGSVIHFMATGATASMADIVRIVASKDSFAITHTSSTSSTRAFTFDFTTPI